MSSPSPTSATPDALRALADLIENTEVKFHLHGLYSTGSGREAQREAFRALRAIPGSMCDTSDRFYVRLTVPLAGTSATFNFSPEALGSKRNVTRAVEEFVLDVDEPVGASS